MKKFYSIIPAALIALSLTACNGVDKSGGQSGDITENNSVTKFDLSIKNGSDNISESDIEAVKNTYNSENETVYDAKMIDLDFDGKNEILVLTTKANARNFDVWTKNNGEMNLTYSFGAGKINFIDKIELKKSEIDGEKVYLFSFSYDEGGAIKADEVLSVIKKTADGSNYEVEHLLSRGSITYSDIAEPFTKEFYHKGWSKYDIGLDTDYGDITQEEYDRLYNEYTGAEISDDFTNESKPAIGNEITAQFELPGGDPVDLTDAVVNGINGEIPLSEMTEDNWLSVTCDYVYLAEPLGVSYNSVDNADIFDKNEMIFTGIPETVPHRYKKYKVGDTFGSLKLVEASTNFIPEWFYMSPKYFNGAKVRFEGEITLTGKCRIAPESVDYATARDIQFVPDAKSTLPVMLYAVDENGGDALNYVMNNDFCCVGEYYSMVLGNADDYSNLDFGEFPDDGSFVNVKVTINNIFYRNEFNFNRVFSARLVNIEIV